ncbi:LuxR C-terminal-related transcriptional regulator [Streptomyces sp. NPDC057621]|uniref:LuxR C-terminal-related transcriptional regulator n=1 Tax=Streptomyces sp. NPDC057621 TaxID=3346186 RepID=UPI00368954D7
MLLIYGQDSVRSQIEQLMGDASDIELIAAVEGGIDGVRLARNLRPDVVLLHVHSSGIDGIEASRQITHAPWAGGIRTVMLADVITETWVLGALNSGVSGFLEVGNETEVLVEAIRTVARGGAHLSPAATRCVLDRIFPLPQISGSDETEERFNDLTPREREMVSLAALGLDNKQISDRLIVSHLTVKTHINRAMIKLNVRSRAQLVAEAHRNGLVGVREKE